MDERLGYTRHMQVNLPMYIMCYSVTRAQVKHHSIAPARTVHPSQRSGILAVLWSQDNVYDHRPLEFSFWTSCSWSWDLFKSLDLVLNNFCHSLGLEAKVLALNFQDQDQDQDMENFSDCSQTQYNFLIIIFSENLLTVTFWCLLK